MQPISQQVAIMDEGTASDGEILVVDDSEVVTRALARLLSRAGYRPVTCASGAEALDRVEQGHAPAAAVVDIHLPDINGLVLSQKLRERFGPDTPIVVVSGDTSTETIKSLPHVGATYFFPKPMSAAALIDRLRTLLNPPTADDDPPAGPQPMDADRTAR